MKIIIDTNVFVSGIFFSGLPFQILKAWNDQIIQLVVSPDILDEYFRVGKILAKNHPKINLNPLLEYLIRNAEIYAGLTLPEAVCDDPDDDKFIGCALACGGAVIVSGDKHLLKVSGYQGIEVLNPRQFLSKYLPVLSRVESVL